MFGCYVFAVDKLRGIKRGPVTSRLQRNKQKVHYGETCKESTY